MRADKKKQSEAYDTLVLRMPKGDPLFNELRAMAKADAEKNGYSITASDLGRAAIRAFVHSRKRETGTCNTFRIQTKWGE